MPQTIRLEFAKSNTKVSKPKQPAAAAATSHPALMHPLTGHKALEPPTSAPMHAPMSLPHPTTLTSIHASLPHFLPSPALASPVGSPSSQPNIAVSNAPCSTLFVANLGQFVSEHELKDIFSRDQREKKTGNLKIDINGMSNALTTSISRGNSASSSADGSSKVKAIPEVSKRWIGRGKEGDGGQKERCRST
ncbi:hypothetical protein KM043_017295 [Ampulex compressa]|nr:hypothetical protein KM043_017295 [Ampulex compressa]